MIRALHIAVVLASSILPARVFATPAQAVLSPTKVPAGEIAKAIGVAKLAKDKWSPASLVVNFGARSLKDVVGEAQPNSRTDALWVTITSAPAHPGDEPIRDSWAMESLSARGSQLPLEKLWPQRSGEYTKFPAFIGSRQPGDKVTFSVAFRQLVATGAKLENGEPEYVWKTRGPEVLASVTVEVGPLEAKLPTPEALLKAVADQLAARVVGQFPNVDNRKVLDASDWQNAVTRAADKDLKESTPPGDGYYSSKDASLYKALPLRLEYSDVKLNGGPECGPSQADGFISCEWTVSAQLKPTLMVRPQKSQSSLFGGGTPSFTARQFPMACTWTVKARVSSVDVKVSETQDWWRTSCTKSK